MSQKCRGKRHKTPEQGIPNHHPSLDQIKRYEKLGVVAPVKLYPSLRAWVRSKGGSPFIRKLIETAKLKEEGVDKDDSM